MLKIIESALSIVDKLLPGRKEKVQNELKDLESQLSEALFVNDDDRASRIRERMSDLRKRIKNINK